MTQLKAVPRGSIRWFLVSGLCFMLAALALMTVPVHAAPLPPAAAPAGLG